ncbi:MAG: sulfate transporter CysZ [Gammaproteobacteria bacterium]|nr:sulfate transporter CysZ [Gammaproteobacteria bacterium]
MIADLASGPRYLLQGYRLIFRPGLRRFFLIPLLVNVLVFAGLVWLFIDQFDALLDWFLPTVDSWWAQLARGLLWFIFAVAASAFMFFTFTLAANLIAAPFNGTLAERVAYVLDKDNMPVLTTDVSLLKSVGLSLISEVRKSIYMLAMILLPLFVTFVPIVNLLAPFLWLMVTSWLLALEYLAYPLENQGMRFSEVRRYAKTRTVLSFSFGVAVLLATLVPVVNLTIMPAAVAGATVMWFERGNHPQATT